MDWRCLGRYGRSLIPVNDENGVASWIWRIFLYAFEYCNRSAVALDTIYRHMKAILQWVRRRAVLPSNEVSLCLENVMI